MMPWAFCKYGKPFGKRDYLGDHLDIRIMNKRVLIMIPNDLKLSQITKHP